MRISNRRERIEFICRKKGNRVLEFFALMTDKEVKSYFESIYPKIKDEPDTTYMSDEVQCVRCSCNVEHHFECLCGYDRAVFSEEDWKLDLSYNKLSALKDADIAFIANGYTLKKS